MSREEVLKKVKEIFKDAFDDEELVIGFETIVPDIEGGDSLMQMNIIEMIEEEFNINFVADEVDTMLDVGSMIDIIISKL